MTDSRNRDQSKPQNMQFTVILPKAHKVVAERNKSIENESKQLGYGNIN